MRVAGALEAAAEVRPQIENDLLAHVASIPWDEVLSMDDVPDGTGLNPEDDLELEFDPVE